MKTQIVRVPFETHSRLKAMASASGETIGEILAKAVESYRRELLLEDTNEAFSKLKEQADLWKGVRREGRMGRLTIRRAK